MIQRNPRRRVRDEYLGDSRFLSSKSLKSIYGGTALKAPGGK